MDSDTPPALLEETLRIQRWADWVAGNAALGGRGAGRGPQRQQVGCGVGARG